MPENQTIIQQCNNCDLDNDNDNLKNKCCNRSDTNNNDILPMNNDNDNKCCRNGMIKNCCSLNGMKQQQQQQQQFKPVTHVIFDLDGLLINSEVCFANAIRILLKRFGINEYSKELQEKVLGMEVARGIEEIIKQTNLPLTVEQFMEMEKEIYTDEMLKVKLMPGAKRLVEHLKKHNIPMAIATGSTNQSFVIKTRAHQDLFGDGKYFHHIVFTRDDEEVKNPKPAPDVYLITASRFPDRPKPEQCLVLEDSSIGVDGARAAGMQCVMVPDQRFECKQKNATIILKSLEDFQPELFGLPPFDD